LYVSYNTYINFDDIELDEKIKIMRRYLSKDTIELLNKIDKIDPEILSDEEKKLKKEQILTRESYYLDEKTKDRIKKEIDEKIKEKREKYKTNTYTNILKFSLDNLNFVAKAEVPGNLINQFSMDEYNNIFRVAVTTTVFTFNNNSKYDIPKRRTENRIYTFDEDMKEIGRLENIAETERIYSTRFIGDKIYMVTFKNIDPFFVIDAKNPKELKILGKLKVPGYNTYLHPYDKNHIIGIGRETDEKGRVKGIKISLYDVTDTKNPIEISKYEVKGKWQSSSAERNHKAFLFSKKRNLLVIPMNIYENMRENFNGVYIFNITNSSITLRGKINLGEESYNTARSLYINEYLYTISDTVLIINKLDYLKEIKRIYFNDKEVSNYTKQEGK
jgi:uncharacterized secreted protein with C-terminal beta-propeller domain